MLKLRDGGLYETRGGRRARVKRVNGVFACPRSFSVTWDINGYSSAGDEQTDLVREIDEKRWIPVCGYDVALEQMTDGGIFRLKRGHLQQLVTRAEAKAKQPAVAVAPVLVYKACVASTNIVDTVRGSFTWSTRRENAKDYLDITTSSGARISLPM